MLREYNVGHKRVDEGGRYSNVFFLPSKKKNSLRRWSDNNKIRLFFTPAFSTHEDKQVLPLIQMVKNAAWADMAVGTSLEDGNMKIELSP